MDGRTTAKDGSSGKSTTQNRKGGQSAISKWKAAKQEFGSVMAKGRTLAGKVASDAAWEWARTDGLVGCLQARIHRHTHTRQTCTCPSDAACLLALGRRTAARAHALGSARRRITRPV
eukprot:11506802-Karenia_brevis.AAC.1